MSQHEIDKLKESQQEIIQSVRTLEQAVTTTRAELLGEMNKNFDELKETLQILHDQNKVMFKRVAKLEDKVDGNFKG